MNPDILSTRRHFLAQNAMGIGGVALAWLLQREGLLAKPVKPGSVVVQPTVSKDPLFNDPIKLGGGKDKKPKSPKPNPGSTPKPK